MNYLDTPNRELLQDLGIRPSSLLISNGIIWVEGPTDAKYIKYWLDLYINEKNKNRKNLVNGIHYSFQYLSPVMYYETGCAKFEDALSGLDSEQIRDVSSLIANNHNFLLVLDKDTDYDKGKLPSEAALTKKEDTPVNHNNGAVKSQIVSEVLSSRGIDENKLIKVKDAYDGHINNNMLVFWVNNGTVESYISDKIISDINIDYSGNKDIFVKNNGYREVNNEIGKVKQKVCRAVIENKDAKINDFDNSLEPKIEALYNTICEWNGFDYKK